MDLDNEVSQSYRLLDVRRVVDAIGNQTSVDSQPTTGSIDEDRLVDVSDEVLQILDGIRSGPNN